MRAACLLALAACAPSAELPFALPSGTRSFLVAHLSPEGVPESLRAYDGAMLPTLLLTSEDGLELLAYEVPLALLELPLADGVVSLLPPGSAGDARPLPESTRRFELVDGAMRENVVSFEQRYGALRLRRPGCPALSPPAREDRVDVSRHGYLQAIAALGADMVVVSHFGRPRDTPFVPPSLSVYRERRELALDLHPLRAPLVAGTPDGRAWFVYESGDAPGPRLCELRPEAPEQPRCAAIRFEGDPVVELAPEAMTAQLVDGRLEIALVNWDHVLWLGGEDAPWRRLGKGGSYPAVPQFLCDVGIQTFALAFDGPGRGIAGFPAPGPLRRFDVQSSSTAPVLSGGVDDSYCRSAYAALGGGAELLLLQPSTTNGMDAPPIALWRPRPTASFEPLRDLEDYTARKLERVGARTLVTRDADRVSYLSYDADARTPPELCSAVALGGRMVGVAVLERELVFAIDAPNETQLLGWTPRTD